MIAEREDRPLDLIENPRRRRGARAVVDAAIGDVTRADQNDLLILSGPALVHQYQDQDTHDDDQDGGSQHVEISQSVPRTIGYETIL
jgi:hypothetical protein